MMKDERNCRYCETFECPLKKQIPYMDLLKRAVKEDQDPGQEKTEEADQQEAPSSLLEQYKRILFHYLKQNHTGENKAVFSRDLEELFQIGGRDIRRIISSLRKDGIPICSDFHKGYYYAEKQSEIADTLKGLGEHIAGVSDTITRLQKAKITGTPGIRSIRIVIKPSEGADQELVLLVS